MKLNTPNKLTIARMIITPVFLAVLLWESLPHRFLVATIIYSFAAITDAIDGKLARKNNQITNFGKLLDPIADKVLTTSALLAFMVMDLCNIWIVMIVLTREFAVASIRMIAAANGVVIPANFWGKLKTVSQMTFTIVIMLLGEVQGLLQTYAADFAATLPDNLLSLISNGLLWITAILTVISGAIYIKDSKNVIDYTK
ncbi:MAG TPA: CDP-diacylglycerol--glycerol-3-phosphate 3-phosphatidyltransferase [Candidatus Fimenecus excrementavium]|nr:CDP-diacylglycerol--glycerol-3-phosphate 3-phosphatidyltransferase [Candidatus Fimenecus excrementavium]